MIKKERTNKNVELAVERDSKGKVIMLSGKTLDPGRSSTGSVLSCLKEIHKRVSDQRNREKVKKKKKTPFVAPKTGGGRPVKVVPVREHLSVDVVDGRLVEGGVGAVAGVISGGVSRPQSVDLK